MKASDYGLMAAPFQQSRDLAVQRHTGEINLYYVFNTISVYESMEHFNDSKLGPEKNNVSFNLYRTCVPCAWETRFVSLLQRAKSSQG